MAPVTHDIAVGARRPDGTWSIECECGDTTTAATEAAAWNAHEAHAGGVRP